MRLGDRRAVRPRLERMEGRQLLSAIVAMEAAQAPRFPSAIRLLEHQIHAQAGGGGSGGGGGGGGGHGSGSGSGSGGGANANPPLGPGFNAYSGNTGGGMNSNGLNNNTSSPLLGNGFPTPHELARETYHSVFSGRYYTGPGRFTDQGTTYYYRGLGSSNMYLHGDFDMAIITPADGSGQFRGTAVLNDKSTNSSGIQGFDILGKVTDVDSKGRPTRLTFAADPNIYSGAFFVEAGQGTLTIQYGAKNSIKANFNGLLYTTGLTSPLTNQDLYARNGRPLRFHPSNDLSKIHNG